MLCSHNGCENRFIKGRCSAVSGFDHFNSEYPVSDLSNPGGFWLILRCAHVGLHEVIPGVWIAREECHRGQNRQLQVMTLAGFGPAQGRQDSRQ